MKVIYNNKMISESEFYISANHRGLTYGDGLFETIIFKNRTIQYLDRHLFRLQNGMAALGMIDEGLLELEKIQQKIGDLLHENNLNETVARIKLMVWRKPGGFFTPLNNRIDYLILANEQLKKEEKVWEAELSENVTLYPTPYSKFKTCNMLPYIMAGLEKEKRNLNELILLNYKNEVTECSASNIFWIKDEIVYTPSLNTGCIEGIMRGVVIEDLKKHDIKVKEVHEFPEVLIHADAVFTTNVSGINILKRFDKRIYGTSTILIDLINRSKPGS